MVWEGRDIAALKWHYGDDLLVRTPAGISRGNGAGKANTMATLTEFPDRQLFGEDVIYSGDEDAGFLSSHRIISTATHHGGAFGPATGAKLTFRTIADTFCKDNRVWDEWLIRDNAAIANQLGGSAKATAEAMIAQGDTTMPLTPDTDVVGPYDGRGNDNAWGIKHAEVLTRIMGADFAVIPDAPMIARATSLVPAAQKGIVGTRWIYSGSGCAVPFPTRRSKLITRLGAKMR